MIAITVGCSTGHIGDDGFVTIAMEFAHSTTHGRTGGSAKVPLRAELVNVHLCLTITRYAARRPSDPLPTPANERARACLDVQSPYSSDCEHSGGHWSAVNQSRGTTSGDEQHARADTLMPYRAIPVTPP